MQLRRESTIRSGEIGRSCFRRFGLLGLLPALLAGSAAAQAAEIKVTNINDSGPGSFRAALSYANEHVNTRIVFNIPATSTRDGVATIKVGAPLPVIEANGTVIDGTTQTIFSNDSNSGGPEIELQSNLSADPAPTPTPTLTSTPRPTPTAIGSRTRADLAKATGRAGAAEVGVVEKVGLVIASYNCVVRGLVINKFTAGAIVISGPLARNNRVEGCYIGTDVRALQALPNGFPDNAGGGAITIRKGAVGTVIGGPGGARNVISGNTGDGIGIVGGSNTIIQGNFIGTNATGSGALGNQQDGINIGEGTGTIIGGTTAAARNIISGNRVRGITLQGQKHRVQGNYIGLDVTGKLPIGNASGIAIYGGQCLIGGTTEGARNIISGNSSGIYYYGYEAVGNMIQGNYIGTDVTGNRAVGNGDGIILNANSNLTIGGTTLQARNLISGNNTGITIYGSNARIQGNYIGTDSTGVRPLGNKGSGIFVVYGGNNVVGADATANVGNSGNTIAFNGAAGILIGSSSQVVRGNSIYRNGQPGIDLLNQGQYYTISTNDVGDGDSGANGLQNYPQIAGARQTGTTLTVTGGLSSLARGAFIIDLYANAAPDRTGFGQGQTYLGSVRVNTDSLGDGTFTFRMSGNFLNKFISATATNLRTRETSEFGMAARVVAGVPISTEPVITAFAPSRGAEGQTVELHGLNLAGATSVAFNGRAAAFEVVSSTVLRAIVPPGATSGRLWVRTPQGAALSPGIFTMVESSGNDFFAHASVLTGNRGQASDSNVSATAESGEPVHAGLGAGKSIWFRWTAPQDGIVTFDTTGTNFDTVLAAYTGSAVNNLRLIISNDDQSDYSGIPLTSRIAFRATSGTTYYIAVDVNAYSTHVGGNFLLNWDFVAGAAQIAEAAVGSGLSTPVITNALSTLMADSTRHLLTLRFSTPLDEESALEARHYRVLVDGRVLVVESVMYKAGSNEVILALPEDSFKSVDRISVMWKNLADTRGRSLAGQAQITVP